MTTLWQSSGSHIDLRTRETGIPNVFVRDAKERWKDLFGKWVVIKVTDEGADVREATAEEIATLVKRKVKTEIPRLSLAGTAPIDLDTLSDRENLIGLVGAKAAGFVTLRKLFRAEHITPKGYAIPFGAYAWFVDRFGITEKVKALLAKRDSLSSDELEKELSALRKSFTEAAKNDEFLQSSWMTDQIYPMLTTLRDATISEQMDDGWDHDCFRFRSSTNAEDLVELTGAGLYESQGGCLHPAFDHPKKTIAHAIAKAWASLWTYRAFTEREYYGISHLSVGMSLLVHRNWHDEDVNGVLLTRSRLDRAYYVTEGNDDDSATNPSGLGSATEVRSTFDGGVAHPYFEHRGAVHLSDEELTRLLSAGEKIWLDSQVKYRNNVNLPMMRMDIEYKFQLTQDGTRKLFIKQARPFHGN